MTISCIQPNTQLIQVAISLSAWIDRNIVQPLRYADRIKNIILTVMYTAFITAIGKVSNTLVATFVLMDNSNNNVTSLLQTSAITVDPSATPQSVKADILAQIQSIATANSITVTSTIDLIGDGIGDALSAITDAPTDSPTNLNTLTTLLGSLTGQVNATNAKQNQIGAAVNLILAVLRTKKFIAS